VLVTVSPDLGPEGSESRLIERVRMRDEAAFAELVDRYHASLVRLATSFVREREVAEEVAQETWLGFLTGLDRFEGRSSLKTWLFSILTNIAKTRGRRESRSVPFSSLAAAEAGDSSPSVDPSRFFPGGSDSAGAWASVPADWEALPEERLLSIEVRARIDSAIAALPEVQRAVIEMRDVGGLSATEVCNALDITETNQRVLLHRARSKVRQALETYLSPSN
jgi:RNA polymerase sigma-70 factor (ECF subfamily)